MLQYKNNILEPPPQKMTTKLNKKLSIFNMWFYIKILEDEFFVYSSSLCLDL
jgi:hypothetical protein